MTTEKNQVYKCSDKTGVVEVLNGSDGALECCGQEMKLLRENTTDAAKEKHVPVVEKVDGGIKVKVGDVAHPMEAEHSIQWIEAIAGDKLYRQYLNPGDAPEAFFPIEDENVVVREYCNLHGLWKV